MLPPLKLKTRIKMLGWESGQEYFLRKGEAPQRFQVKSVGGLWWSKSSWEYENVGT